MAKFKCVHTGNIVEFTAQHDVDVMRKHAEYTEVLEDIVEEVKPVSKPRKAASIEE